MINKDGNVISTPKNESYDIIKGIIEDLGMIVVNKELITYEVTEDQGGVINIEGDWQVNLRNIDVLTKLNSNNGYISGYLGEGFLQYREWDPEYSFYAQPQIINVNNGKELTYLLSYNSGNYGLGMHEKGNRLITSIENSLGVFMRDANVFSINVNDSTEKEILKGAYTKGDFYENYFGMSNWGILGKYKEGLFYFSDIDAGGQSQGFYDIEGNLQIDLREYEFEKQNTTLEFIDSYCLLPIKNPQGSSFFTIIDTSGKMMFEPINYLPGNSNLLLKSGLVVYKNGNGRFSIVDTFGNHNIELDNEIYEVSNFYEDVALVESRLSNQNSYGLRMEVYYIDKNGERLF
jgi:hypothetical protein